MKQILENYSDALICTSCGEIFGRAEVKYTRRDEECCPCCGDVDCIEDADVSDVCTYVIEELRAVTAERDRLQKMYIEQLQVAATAQFELEVSQAGAAARPHRVRMLLLLS